MISKTFNRYIWLLNIMLQRKHLTFEEISHLWATSDMGDGKPMPLRTFHQHKNAVEELFGVHFRCNPSAGYQYSLTDLQVLQQDRTRQWLLSSFSLSNMITAGHNMKGRILFEEVPHGTEYLQLIIEAMQQEKVLEIDYQPFGGHRTTYHYHPYAMKVYRQRWYVVGKLVEQDAIRHIALDRVLDLTKTDATYNMPKNFDAERYYAHTVGIFVNEELKPQKLRIRVFGKQVEYLRYLPLHKSQKEVLTKHEEFSEFEYRVCLTPELSTHILSMGEHVVVLEPEELKLEIKERLKECLSLYE